MQSKIISNANRRLTAPKAERDLCKTPSELTAAHLRPTEDKDAYCFRQKPCPFLRNNCCTVYDARPDDCRSFPHLHKDEFVFRLIQVVNNCSVCPIVYNVFERLKEELWHSKRI
jgi:hypothetical protein